MIAKLSLGILTAAALVALPVGVHAAELTPEAVKVVKVSPKPTPKQKSANVSVKMTPDEVHPGQRVVPSITVVNTGDVTIEGATIQARVADGLKYVDGTANGELLESNKPTVNSHGALVWKLKPVKPGRQASVWFSLVPQAGVFGTRCVVGLLDPTGLGHPSDKACVSVTPRPRPVPTPAPVIGGQNQNNRQNTDVDVNNTNNNNNNIDVNVNTGAEATESGVPAKLPETGASEAVTLAMIGGAPAGFALRRFGQGALGKVISGKEVASIVAERISKLG